MRVLGIDPGTRKLGWGVVERRSAKLRGVAAGVVSLDPKTPLHDRLARAFEQVELMIEDHAPDVIAVEDVFFARFASAAIKLGHVRGVVLLAAARNGKPLTEWPPALVKRTVAGRGAAEKAQVGRVVAATLGLATVPPADAADALAIAITHLASTPMLAMAKPAIRRAR
ncbi:crossover junction endodeoxyribonuclease RuvC [Sandaracinus amylolyticus]|uniref:Crossover junction endodeoxyribonuclease RuvC n=1 Tax=Sandaracinus amylolyticus TaxID=927083 RepID=A0A0F6YGH7_9BACT|nr:crossover junction endodeoxyribonuclease RuvC [Sandaracinus amylolyticus]AKF04735.1 Crossover junction endodeoxyribonuclease RuvC [Sandaracinus amylolyticus]